MKNKQAYFDRLLEICGDDQEMRKGFIKEAYKVALDTRKFEIDMYWRRATYFWAFIVAIFVAYFAAKENQILQTILSMLGFFFCFGLVHGRKRKQSMARKLGNAHRLFGRSNSWTFVQNFQNS